MNNPTRHGSALVLCCFTLAIACKKPHENPSQVPAINPVTYFEIPVTDMDRAMDFYSKVFNLSFERALIDGNEMALFPLEETAKGISGALARGEIYQPTQKGVLVYFNTKDIDRTLALAVENGGRVLYPKTSHGEWGWVAEFEDSEGNRIALHQPADRQN